MIIACDGTFYSVHKLVLSSASGYFEEIFDQYNDAKPTIIIKDISADIMAHILQYMYVGKIDVAQEKLDDLLTAAQTLKIYGLAVPDKVQLQENEYNSKNEECFADKSLEKEPKFQISENDPKAGKMVIKRNPPVHKEEDRTEASKTSEKYTIDIARVGERRKRSQSTMSDERDTEAYNENINKSLQEKRRKIAVKERVTHNVTPTKSKVFI